MKILRNLMHALKVYIVLFMQISLLYLINLIGNFISSAAHIPIPGNVIGILILFMLLSTKVIRLEWVDKGGALLIRHLAFFFIPVAVALMNYKDLFLSEGIGILTVIIISFVFGLFVTGYTSQLLAKRKESQHG